MGCVTWPDAQEPIDILGGAGLSEAVLTARPDGDAALVRAAKAGDASAFGQLYERYRDVMYRYCLARTGGAYDAEDLVADVFIRAMEALHRYEDRGLPFVAFLYRIARNASIDRGRRLRPDMSIDDLTAHPESGQNVEAEAMRALERTALASALARIKGEYREVLLLRFVEGYPAVDVGRMTGRSEGAVRTLQHRALERLRKELEKTGELRMLDRWAGSEVAP